MNNSRYIIPILLLVQLLLGCRHAAYIALEDTGSPAAISDDNESNTATDGGLEEQVPPKNVILFIGDGMGQSHIEATGIYEYGEPNTLYFESFPVHGFVTTKSANSEITDSAAAATAMACGVKVNNYVLSLAIPGDGSELPSLVDFYKYQQKSTGLVTTTYITHATPAAFAAHAVDRNDVDLVAWHYIYTGRPNVLFGGGGYGMVLEDVTAAGYTVIDSLIDFEVLLNSTTDMVAGLFGEGFYPYEASGVMDRPHLYESGVAAVRFLSRNPNGFFVMIEGGMIDQGAHLNRLDLVVGEVIAFEKTIQDVVKQVNLDETLVIVTADHATGDLQIVKNNGIGLLPSITWGTTGHDAGNVDLFAIGNGSDAFDKRFDEQGGVIDNTEIHEILTQF